MKQGEIWMVDFGAPSGPEQAGNRPAVVLQDNPLSEILTTVVVVPLTTNTRRLLLPATLRLEAGEGGLTQTSIALCYQIQVRGKARFLYKMGTLSPERFADVQDAVLTALGL